jgi:hypothetical protein
MGLRGVQPATAKTCTGCGAYGGEDIFYTRGAGLLVQPRKECQSKDPNRDAAKRRWNKSEEGRAYARQWHRDHPEAMRRQKFKERYGITLEQYERLLEVQGGACAICKSKDIGHSKHKHFSVDHDHVTGVVRGLLCNRCNVGLGSFKDNMDSLQAAIEYLRKQNV